MNLGLFFMPHLAPERTPKQGQEFILETIRKADELGYQEAWIGEHFACGWEPVPAPDLLIAQALLQTKQIVLAPGAVLPREVSSAIEALALSRFLVFDKQFFKRVPGVR